MGKLGCDICYRASQLDVSADTAWLSTEWSECKIAAYGNTTTKKQASLRKQIYQHRNSDAHKSAENLLKKRCANDIAEAVARQAEQHVDVTCKVFCTAYYTAQADRPYTDHPELIRLQQVNGLDLGRVLHSNVTCTDIVNHIATQMRQSLVDTITSKKCCMSVLIDESTTLSRLSCLVVYVRATFDADVGPVTFFVDMVELHATDANETVAAVLQCLAGHGFTEEFLKESWVGLAVDGASVMLGSKCGVATQLKRLFPLLVSWHCFNHRLELAVSDAIKSTTQANHFRIFLSLIQMLKATANENPATWPQKLPTLMSAYRMTVHKTTGITPNMAMLGREVMLPTALIARPPEETTRTSVQFVRDLRDALRDAHDKVRVATQATARTQKL